MDVKICRICLNTNVRMYSYSKDYIKDIYLKVLDFKIDDDSILPQYICYECMSLLMKFIKFRQKCMRGLQALEQLCKTRKITAESIKSINRIKYNLLSSCNIHHNYSIDLTSLSGKKENESNKSNDISETLIHNIKKEDEVRDAVCNDDDIKSQNEINDYGDSNVESDTTDEKNKDFLFVEINSVNINNIEETQNLVQTDTNKLNSMSTNFKGTDQKLKVGSIPVKKQHRRKRKGKQNKDNPDIINSFLRNKEKWTTTKLTDEEALNIFQSKAKSSRYLDSRFKCSLCYKAFSNIKILSRHNFISHNEKYKQECKMCKVRRKIPYHLKAHMRSHYFVYKCQICDFTTMISEGARHHNAVHENTVRTCQFCGEAFKHISTFNTHLRLQHPSQHLCRICGKSFVSALGVKRHMRVTHLETVKETDASLKIDENSENEEVYCGLCEISFQTKEAYDKHMLHSAKHKESDIFLKPIGSRRKRRNNTKYNDIDSNGFVRIMKKKAKIINDKGKTKNYTKYIICTVCNKSFKFFKQVHEHHLKEHVGIPFNIEDRVVCEVCGAYIKEYNLQIHMNTHTHERMHPCKLCSREFTTLASVVRHMATHTGEKNYKCDLCDKRYTQNASLTLHINTIHLKKPYPKRNRWKNKLKISSMQSQETETLDSKYNLI